MVSQSAGSLNRAPLDPAELDRTLAPFPDARMLPRAAYVSDEVFEWEQRRFFDGEWVHVGRSEAVGTVGDQRAEQLGRSGVLLIRDEGGRLRAFANVCRHRGHELLPCGGSTNRQIVVCPYHAWNYHLDGSVRRAPGFSEKFDTSELGLVELAVEEWHGWVFVNAGCGAGPLSSHVAGLEEIVAPYEPERLREGGRHEYVVAANWKILNENYQECYHCPVIHPELCAASPPRSGENYEHDAGAWVGGWMDLREGWATMSLDGTTSASVLRSLHDDARRQVVYLGVFPNVLISLHPDYVMTHRLTPLAVDRTRIECTWHFAPEDVARDDFNPAFAVDFWDVTNRQDWLACESVQRGLSSGHAVPGPLSAAEDGVYQFVTMVARAYRGEAALPVTAGLQGDASPAGRR